MGRLANREKPRCGWCGTDPLYIAYHDEEWGVPAHDDRHLFEMLILEGAQAGLSWITILRKREAYREAFRGFDPIRVAALTDGDLEAILQDSGIVRNRLKIFSARDNARAFMSVQGGLRQLRRLPLVLRGWKPEGEPPEGPGRGPGGGA